MLREARGKRSVLHLFWLVFPCNTVAWARKIARHMGGGVGESFENPPQMLTSFLLSFNNTLMVSVGGYNKLKLIPHSNIAKEPANFVFFKKLRMLGHVCPKPKDSSPVRRKGFACLYLYHVKYRRFAFSEAFCLK